MTRETLLSVISPVMQEDANISHLINANTIQYAGVTSQVYKRRSVSFKTWFIKTVSINNN